VYEILEKMIAPIVIALIIILYYVGIAVFFVKISVIPAVIKELFRNNMCSLRRIFLRECISKNVGVAGYGEAF